MTRGETIREDYRPSQASAKVRFTLTGDGDLFPEMLESSEEEDVEIRDAKSITKKGFHIDDHQMAFFRGPKKGAIGCIR